MKKHTLLALVFRVLPVVGMALAYQVGRQDGARAPEDGIVDCKGLVVRNADGGVLLEVGGEAGERLTFHKSLPGRTYPFWEVGSDPLGQPGVRVYGMDHDIPLLSTVVSSYPPRVCTEWVAWKGERVLSFSVDNGGDLTVRAKPEGGTLQAVDLLRE